MQVGDKLFTDRQKRSTAQLDGDRTENECELDGEEVHARLIPFAGHVV